MKKILFAANVDYFFIKFLEPQLKYFHEKGYEIHTASRNEDVEIPYSDKKFDVPFARSFNVKDNINSYRKMKKIIKENNYDIIFCHTPFGGAITRLAAKSVKTKARIIYEAHGFHFYKGASLKYWLIFYNAEKYLSKYTDTIITINKEDYEIAKRKFYCNVEYVKGIGLIPNKLNVSLTKKEKEEIRKSLGIKPSDFVIIYAAEISDRKRQEWLVETLEKTIKKNKDIHLLLPGKDLLEGRCHKLIEKLNLQKKVHLLGFRRDIPNLLKISDLAVSSSKQEGLAVNIMEAMYMGLPIIVTDCRGNSDLVVNNKNGFIVYTNDSYSFSRKVEELYNNKKISKIFGNNSKKIVNEYLIDNVMDDYIKIYETKRVAYLRSTSVINDSRASKEIESYRKNNNKVIVFGWNRQNLDLQNNLENIYFNEKSKYGNGIKNIFKMLKFERWLYKKLKKQRKNYDIIHACDFDTAYVGYKISKKYHKRLVYDIYDYYVDCHNLSFLKNIVEKMDIKIINKADTVIICTEQRKKQISKSKPKKLIVIHNTPDIKIEENKNDFNPNKIKVCYVGILQDDRLLKEICEKIINENSIELHIGGFGKYEEFIKDLSKKYKNIKYYGQMKYSEVLELEKKCDILFATYNPEIPNHKYSAPNKVYEAMSLGKPIIVCKNTGVDELVEKEKIGYSIKYDADEFIKIVKKITQTDYNVIASKTQHIYEEKYSWKKMEKLLINNLKGE